MVSNSSVHPLEPLDPSLDPAYRDGPPPPPRRATRSGELPVDWPFARLPWSLQRYETISFETLEDVLEREATREETFA